jgi:drug/metabolite transporter superfamily protein YnfA
MFGINQQLLMQAFGACFIIAGLAARLGLWKKWYWRTRGAIYGYIPLGLLFILYAFSTLAEERLGSTYVAYQGVGVLLIVLGLWWSVRPPALVKPSWVRWVEEYPESVREAMVRAVEEGEEWESHVESREAVDAWARGLRARKRRSKGR